MYKRVSKILQTNIKNDRETRTPKWIPQNATVVSFNKLYYTELYNVERQS